MGFVLSIQRMIGSRATGDRAISRRPSLVAVALVLVALAPGLAFAQSRPSRPAPPAAPPAAATAADLAKQGIELYQAGDYPGAVELLRRAHEMEPNTFAHRFALAQALRQAGNCAEAIPHYQALIEATPDPEQARDIRSSMAACPGALAEPPQPPPPPALPPPPPAPPPPPPAVASGGISRSNAALMVGAGASFTAAIVLFTGARLDRGDAESARSFDEFDRISGRADMWYAASVVAAGAGVGLAVLSVVRHRKSRQRGTELAISSRAGGGVTVLLGSSF